VDDHVFTNECFNGFIFEDNDQRQMIEGRYYNCQGIGVAIVAVITKGIDWAAYIGADKSSSEDATLRYIADYGSKLSEKDARHFFKVSLPYRR